MEEKPIEQVWLVGSRSHGVWAWTVFTEIFWLLFTWGVAG